jgi:hypothetical protein
MIHRERVFAFSRCREASMKEGSVPLSAWRDLSSAPRVLHQFRIEDRVNSSSAARTSAISPLS